MPLGSTIQNGGGLGHYQQHLHHQQRGGRHGQYHGGGAQQGLGGGDMMATAADVLGLSPLKDLLGRIANPGGKWWWVQTLLAGGAVVYLLLNRISRIYRRRLRRGPPLLPFSRDVEEYDVCVVGSGPAGAACAYFLAKKGRKVLLLERKAFPRDKICGDAVAPRAQKILREMNVLQELPGVQKVNTGGFVSPSGKSFIGNFTEEQVLTIQRIVLDEKIANAAERAGAALLINTEVNRIAFNPKTGLWSIYSTSSLPFTPSSSSTSTSSSQSSPAFTSSVTFRARVVVAADGAMSRLARSLGVVTTPPNTMFSRSFAKAGTHNFRADNVLFYPRQMLPGYFVINREPEDYLNLSCILLPGPPGSVRSEDLFRIYKSLVTSDPSITAALGPEVVLSPYQSCAVRVGGVPRSYADHFLVVGDAAGHVDPLTGEGLQYGLEAGKLAAQTLVEALENGDLSERSLKKYHQRWRRAFGWDFAISARVSEWFFNYPLILDAAAEVIQRNGEEFIAPWSLCRTGAKSKAWYLRPDVGPAILLVALLWWLKGNGTAYAAAAFNAASAAAGSAHS